VTPPDEITLTIPRDRALYSVAHLVLGGVGIRLNLTIEHLEDLQLALETALDRVRADVVTVTLRVKDGEIEALVGPMSDGVRAELAADGGEDVGLRRILDTLVDRAELETDDGVEWLKLTKAAGRTEA
jgi:predicted RecB family endonuclease